MVCKLIWARFVWRLDIVLFSTSILRHEHRRLRHEFAVAVDEVIDIAVRVRERSWAVALVILEAAAVDVARGVVVGVPCSHARERAPAKNERTNG